MNKKLLKGNFNFLTGFTIFRLATLTLIISPTFSIFLFLISAFKSSFKNLNNYFKDKFNITLLISGLFMIMSLIKNTLVFDNEYNLLITKENWLDLFNWIPFFLLFFFFQEYLSNQKKRKQVALIFLLGSSPLILIGLLQAWFGLPGIYFNFIGTIKFVSYSGDFITGVFNNPNINGLWLGLMVPFFMNFLKTQKDNIFIKLLSIFLFVGLIFCIFFTYSRLAFLSLFIGSLLLINKKRIMKFISIFFIPLLLVNFLKFFSDKLVNFFIFGIYPLTFVKKFSISYDGIITSPRLKLWLDSFSYIYKRPIFGWGPFNFSKIYELDNLTFFGHSHNLPIELALNYGIICSLLISCTIFYLLIKTFVVLFIKSKKIDNDIFFDKAWFLASFITFINHIFDIQYYDGRISILSWIMMAGLKCILDENKKANLQINTY